MNWYDEGYQRCDCFWGTTPGSYVSLLAKLFPDFRNLRVLDVGCGEGKNAAFLAVNGASVDALDISSLAIRNGRRQWPHVDSIKWILGDVGFVPLPTAYYDIVVAYGLLHCLKDEDQIRMTVGRLQNATAFGGYNVVCTFNDLHQELAEAHPGFTPCLLSHRALTAAYASWEILAEADSDLTEQHPHNNIVHTHSMTRILARKARH